MAIVFVPFILPGTGSFFFPEREAFSSRNGKLFLPGKGSSFFPFREVLLYCLYCTVSFAFCKAPKQIFPEGPERPASLSEKRRFRNNSAAQMRLI